MKKNNILKVMINVLGIACFLLLFLSAILRFINMGLIASSLKSDNWDSVTIVAKKALASVNVKQSATFFEMLTLVLVVSIVFVNWFVFGIKRGQENSFMTISTYWVSLLIVLTVVIANLSWFNFGANTAISFEVLFGLWELVLAVLIGGVSLYTILKNNNILKQAKKEIVNQLNITENKVSKEEKADEKVEQTN